MYVYICTELYGMTFAKTLLLRLLAEWLPLAGLLSGWLVAALPHLDEVFKHALVGAGAGAGNICICHAEIVSCNFRGPRRG